VNVNRTAVIFSGQGAQSVGMGKDLAEVFPECRALYEQADRILGYSLSKVCFEGPQQELTRTDRCQPAIFVTSLACLAALRKEMPGMMFEAVAGLSLGEWTALHAAGVLSFEDALRVLDARGRFMQEACERTQGGMVSVVGLPADRLAGVCAAAGVEVSNFNSPEQTVLSGEREAIGKAEQLAREAGASRTIMLQVAGAYHSRLMAPAAAQLEVFLRGVPLRQPEVTAFSNATGLPHGDPEAIRGDMVRQVTSPVQWVDCVRGMRSRGVTRFVECGPGRVLTGLIKRIDNAAGLHNIQDLSSLRKTVGELKA
jgi:[acyl-carrier-protein] S-malonyltransferase